MGRYGGGVEKLACDSGKPALMDPYGDCADHAVAR